jgi:hypothetical protein
MSVQQHHMAKMAETEKKTCFIVGQIGGEGSTERIHSDWLLEGVIKPVFKDHFPDYVPLRADKIADPGMIDAQIINHLLSAPLAIADLTGLNPNAFYEIGIRHVAQLPVVHMHLRGTRIPFDVQPARSIEFGLTQYSDLTAARESLREAISAVLSPGFKIDNPVTRARGKVEFERSATPKEKLLEGQISTLTTAVEDIRKTLEAAQIELPPQQRSPRTLVRTSLTLHGKGEKGTGNLRGFENYLGGFGFKVLSSAENASIMTSTAVYSEEFLQNLVRRGAGLDIILEASSS